MMIKVAKPRGVVDLVFHSRADMARFRIENPRARISVLVMHDAWCDGRRTGAPCFCEPEYRVRLRKD